jgi:hypothetical protein
MAVVNTLASKCYRAGYCGEGGAKILSITTLSIMTLSITIKNVTLRITTLSALNTVMLSIIMLSAVVPPGAVQSLLTLATLWDVTQIESNLLSAKVGQSSGSTLSPSRPFSLLGFELL